MAEYIADLSGKELTVDGGDFYGKHGMVGIYRSQEEAVAAARKEANETCTIRITLRGTRDADAQIVYQGT